MSNDPISLEESDSAENGYIRDEITSNAADTSITRPSIAQSLIESLANVPVHSTIELLFCVLAAGIGHVAPGYIFQLALNERGVPYQETANGDIILDLYLNREYMDDTIPDWLLVVLCMVLPFVVILAVSFYLKQKHDLYAGACSYLFAIGCTEFITSFVKEYVGYWRPNFYEYCGFDEDSMQCDGDHEKDSRRSFPSGHASISFCGMTMISLFFLGKIGLHPACFVLQNSSDVRYALLPRLDNIGTDQTSAYLFKKRILSIISVLPMFIAIFVSASRVHDNKHHPADVIAGAIIGMICANFSYGLWYCPISSIFSGFPIHAAYDVARASN
mmetsp:Transcript_31431/g.36144  ORF Transcript_31431/g.36144 Transcript_31431/m.36144 type:complete len:331 (+) Transcript_31431:114-1106(+)